MMPKDYEWPVWPNDGEPVRIGDWYTLCGVRKHVERISFQGNRDYVYAKVDTVGAGFLEDECEHIPEPPLTERLEWELERRCDELGLTQDQAVYLYNLFERLREEWEEESENSHATP